MKNTLRSLSFHPAGWPFMAGAVVLALLLSFVGGLVAVLGIIGAAWCFYFFRDPARVTPVREGLVISPADGRVVAVKNVIPEEALGFGSEPCTRVSIFLNVFNVHVNRIPVDGEVIGRRYRAGKFINASLDKASEDNERMAVAIRMDGTHPYKDKTLGVVQIAGLIARRIVCDAQEGQQVKAGARFGIIRFGSRTDVYLPQGIAPLVAIGQTMLGGETVIADLCSQEATRKSEVRP